MSKTRWGLKTTLCKTGVKIYRKASVKRHTLGVGRQVGKCRLRQSPLSFKMCLPVGDDNSGYERL